MMTQTLRPVLWAAALAALLGTQAARAADKVSIIMSWTAEAEHGGFFQALATGIYKKHGLDVTVRQGGPQLNTAQMLAAGAVDFRIGSNSGGTLNYVANHVPAMAVAAIFQKEPTALIAHPDVGINSLADMKGKPIAISQQSIDSWWRFLRAKFGFTNTQIRPYTFQIAPFLVNKDLIQQAYVTSEPFAVETQGHFTPKVFLLADAAGYKSYATLIETTTKLVKTNPALVQRMVDATIEGWYSYLYGNPAPANALIKQANPDMTDAQIAYSYAKMKEYGIIDSGDAKKLGIGAMTNARWKSFFESAAAVGLYPKTLDYKKAYTLQFVDKKHAMEAAR
ncbi:MAG TPA: ABC transporter substrate-binding protein [Stellaceae bacterium]|nr:ABC transporter substrate-binding protein [Stellaceae bacterium]